MLSFVIVKDDGTKAALDPVLTAVWDCDMDVPADSLTVTCPFDGELRDHTEELRVYENGRLLFCGKPDELAVIKEKTGVILRISARSPAAGLLDNEAEPLVYNSPNVALIAKRHLLPFGVTPAEDDSVPYYDRLQIEKGETHWQVLQRFCRGRYGSEPRIAGDGTAYLQGYSAKGNVVFSDGGEGVAYYSLKESSRRHRLISEVRVKVDRLNGYRSRIGNPNPAVREPRVRYINAAKNSTALAAAYRILRNSNRDSYALTLECPGCGISLLGKSAEVRDSVLGVRGGLAVSKVRYTAGSKGERSVITLKGE